MNGHAIILAAAAFAAVALFGAGVTVLAIVLFGGRGAPDQPDRSNEERAQR